MFQDIWVWNGRPDWDAIFSGVKANEREQRAANVGAAVGVMYCGNKIIGNDLISKCEQYTSLAENVSFNLHKENF
jgi:hypothetical protein